MKALVTGATGAVGRAVVGRLLAEGHDVAIATRRPFLAERIFEGRVAAHEWHPLSEPLPPAALDDRDCILSLMGAPIAGGRSRDRDMLAATSRARAIRRLGEATAGRGLRWVVASLAFAPPGPGEPLREADAIGQPASPTARVVAEWEAEALAAHARGGSVAVVRLGLVAADSCVLRELVRLARLGIVPRLKGSLVPAITLDDAAAMLAGIMERPTIGGLVHGVAPMAVKGEALTAALQSIAPVSRPIVLPLSLLRRRLGLAVALLGCQRQITPDVLARSGAVFAAPDPTELLARAVTEIAVSRGATHSPPPVPPQASGHATSGLEPELPEPDAVVSLKPQP